MHYWLLLDVGRRFLDELRDRLACLLLQVRDASQRNVDVEEVRRQLFDHALGEVIRTCTDRHHRLQSRAKGRLLYTNVNTRSVNAYGSPNARRSFVASLLSDTSGYRRILL